MMGELMYWHELVSPQHLSKEGLDFVACGKKAKAFSESEALRKRARAVQGLSDSQSRTSPGVRGSGLQCISLHCAR